MIRAAAVFVLIAACGDNVAPVETPPDCTGRVAPPTGMSLEAAREAHRRAALRQQLRYREAADPGYVLRTTAPLVDAERLAQKLVCTQDILEVGRVLFEHAYSFEDGLAAGSTSAPFRRVQAEHGGPETTTCTSCHWRSGPAGAGSVADASFLSGDGASIASADARNPPSLIGSGVVQAIAREMTAELAALRENAIATAKRTGKRVEIALVAKGIAFGELAVDPSGRVDTEGVRGVDPDLVIRPFGWKGTAATIDEFVVEAAAVHLGVQAAPDDPDEDGIADELTVGQLTALSAYIAALEIPVMAPHEQPVDRADPAGPTVPYLVDEWSRGRLLFEQVGCARCHVPSLVLDNPTVVVGSGVDLDLARDSEAPRITANPAAPGYQVWTFSDFRRHDLGDENASKHLQGGIASRFYLTRRLWGLGDTAPYLYDGSAVTVDDAIRRHGGDAAGVREAWRQLPAEAQSDLRVFLMSLRRAPRLSIP